MAVAGHLWTVASRLRPRPPLTPARAWHTEVRDPFCGTVRLSGLLCEEPESDALLLFVHGIGGSATAVYAETVARAAHLAGISCLRLNLRGCDRASNDYYHAGLSSDLGAALASPEAGRYRRVLILGYSMGGHLALHHATHDPDPRLAAVVAVSAPVDLTAAGKAIDEPARWPYRRYVLRNLMTVYVAVARHRPVPVPVAEAQAFTRLRQWDDLVVAPRWGFEDAADYHRRAAVGPHLARVEVPALLIAAAQDPLIPQRAMIPPPTASPRVELRLLARGGHVGFPPRLDLGVPGPLGLEAQSIAWLRQHNTHKGALR